MTYFKLAISTECGLQPPKKIRVISLQIQPTVLFLGSEHD